MKTSRAAENRCVFSARLNTLSDWSGDRSAGGRWFHVDGSLTAKLRCSVAFRAREPVDLRSSASAICSDWHSTGPVECQSLQIADADDLRWQ